MKNKARPIESRAQKNRTAKPNAVQSYGICTLLRNAVHLPPGLPRKERRARTRAIVNALVTALALHIAYTAVHSVADIISTLQRRKRDAEKRLRYSSYWMTDDERQYYQQQVHIPVPPQVELTCELVDRVSALIRRNARVKTMAQVIAGSILDDEYARDIAEKIEHSTLLFVGAVSNASPDSTPREVAIGVASLALRQLLAGVPLLRLLRAYTSYADYFDQHSCVGAWHYGLWLHDTGSTHYRLPTHITPYTTRLARRREGKRERFITGARVDSLLLLLDYLDALPDTELLVQYQNGEISKDEVLERAQQQRIRIAYRDAHAKKAKDRKHNEQLHNILNTIAVLVGTSNDAVFKVCK